MAAAQVFEAHGLAAGTTNRIAERAGVSVGTLYQYFADKQAMATTLVERHLADMLGHVRAWASRVEAAQAGLRAALLTLVETALATHEVQPHLHRVLLEEAPLPAAVHEAILRTEREAGRAIALVLRRFPEIRRRDLQRAADMAVQVVVGLTHGFTVDRGEWRSRAAFVGEVADMLEAYLRAPPG